MAKVFIHCPNDNYDSEDGGCSVGPDVVGSDMEDAAARWNRRAQAPDDLPPVPYNEHEKELLKEIESRDNWEEKATELAERVGEYFGLNVGEHSNINCPVQTALEADWQSQQAQGDPVAFARMLGGEVDWDENCLFPDAETGISDLDGRGDSDEYEIVPLYRHPPVLANMPEQGEHTKPVADAVKHLNDWLSMGLCGCEGPGHSCGATKIRNTIEGLEKLLNAPPAPAAVPEFDKKLFDSECRESVAGALGFPRGGDYAWSYLLAQIKEAVAAGVQWQSQQAQGEAQGFTDYDAGALNDWGGGDVGWWQDYIRSEIERANDHWREQTGPEPLYLAPPAPAAVPEEATPEMEQAAERYWNERRFKGLTNDPRTWAGVYRAMVAAAPQPTPAAVPDGWKMVPVEPTDHMSDVGMVSAGIDITENDARHVYSAMLTASPAPEHSGDGNEMVPALRQYRHNYGGGFVFAYDKEQTDRIVTGLVKALEPFAECASELDGSPEDGIEPTDDDEWAKFRLLVSDYRRARAALAAYRKQGDAER